MTLLERCLMKVFEMRFFQDVFMFTIVGKKARDLLAYIGQKRGREPEVIFPDDALAIPTDSILWVDCRASWDELYETMPIIIYGLDDGGKELCLDIGDGDYIPFSNYGFGKMVYWTSRPTDEQRKAITWQA